MRILLVPVLVSLLGCMTSAPAYRSSGVSAGTGVAGFVQVGTASYYGRAFHGKTTASGETFDMYAMTCAHRTLPLGTLLRVENLDNGRTVTVRVNDRGPYVEGRIVDLSYGAAERLGMLETGTARVRLTSLGSENR